MKNTSERRQMILEYLLEHRETTRFELFNHFNVSLRTIERDILILSCSYPIITIADGYRLGMKYLSESQAALLEQLSETLSGKDLEIMQSILKIFSKPASCK